MAKFFKIFPAVTLLMLIVYAGLPILHGLGLVDWMVMFKGTRLLVSPLIEGEGISLLTSPFLMAGLLSAIAMIVLFVSGKAKSGLFTLLIAVLAMAPVYAMKKLGDKAQMVPAIHDITTDTVDPPQFILLAGKREKAANPDAYDTKQTAKQLEAYPDIKTFVTDKSPDEVLSASRQVLESMGIKIAGVDQALMQIEGTATTRWFRFKDDVIIRIRPSEAGTLVDMRSKSRVGRSDIGTNAKRIRTFMEGLQKAL